MYVYIYIYIYIHHSLIIKKIILYGTIIYFMHHHFPCPCTYFHAEYTSQKSNITD